MGSLESDNKSTENQYFDDDKNESSFILDVKDEFWDPPEAENEEDDMEHNMGFMDEYDDDDDDDDGDGKEWAKSSSLMNDFGEEEKRKAMEEVKNGKFKNLVSQLLPTLGINESIWLDVITMLAWQAAMFVKPDGTEGKAMDPSACVKIKCIATGSPSESRLVKGLVFRKHAAHKYMANKYKKPRLLLIQGMLDPSSGSSGLSSFNSFLHEFGVSDEDDKSEFGNIIENLKMSHANVILVEKSASRDVLNEVLKLGVTMVLNMKLHRLERVARCTGSPIRLPSDVIFNQDLKCCDSLYFERIVEDHAIVDDGGKKPCETLMFLEGYPTRLGCTILLKGSHSEELKKIKCVLKCAVVMAYNFILETSFLEDQKTMFSTIALARATDFASADAPISTSYKDSSVPLLEFDADAQDCIWPEDAIRSVLDSESILVSVSSQNASSGTICEQSHDSHIKFYRDFDVSFGKFLWDNLFNQSLECKACGELPETHIYYYEHHNKQRSIQVKRIGEEKLLSGESEGKLWMWSRCGKCELGKEKPTKRVLISTTTRGLSFGKFLELSFSTHSSYNMLSSCGHSFQKDFLHFFGSGAMVAVICYSSVAQSAIPISLRRQKLEFSGSLNSWFQHFAECVCKGLLLFAEVVDYLRANGHKSRS